MVVFAVFALRIAGGTTRTAATATVGEAVSTGGGAADGQPPPSDELFAYPRNGQSEEPQQKDKDDCQRWAAAQTGFDPSSRSPIEKRNEYFRARVACLEGRGYSVK
jgi:hypothetical protein